MEHPEVVHLAAFDHLKRSSIFQSLSSQRQHILPDGFNLKRVSKCVCESRDTLATDLHHIPRRLLKSRFAYVMPRLFVHHDPPYIRCQLRIPSTPHDLPMHIMFTLPIPTRPPPHTT